MSEKLGSRALAGAIVTGLFAAALYSSIVFLFAALAPLALLARRQGSRLFAVASLSAILGVGVFQAVLLIGGPSLSLTEYLGGLAPALGLIGGFAVIVLPKPLPAETPFVFRVGAGALLASLSALPSVLALRSDPLVVELLDRSIAQVASMPGVSGLDVAAFKDLAIGIAEKGFAAALFLYLFLNAWLYQNARSPAAVAIGKSDQVRTGLAGYMVPRPLVWLLLVSWAAILANRYVGGPVLGALAWNLGLSLSVCYAIQGLAVVSVRIAYSRLASVGRIMPALLVVLVAVGGPVGIGVAALLVLVGTLETWIPLRNIPEGDTP